VIGMCRNRVKSEVCPILGGRGSVEVRPVEKRTIFRSSLSARSRPATLTRIFDPHNLTLIGTSCNMLFAVEVWKFRGRPEKSIRGVAVAVIVFRSCEALHRS
jgi:hypothetical protein